MHVGALCIVDAHRRTGLGVRTPPSALGGASPSSARFAMKVKEVPLGLDLPVLVPDPHFKLDHHLHRLGLPSPGGPRALGSSSPTSPRSRSTVAARSGTCGSSRASSTAGPHCSSRRTTPSSTVCPAPDWRRSSPISSPTLPRGGPRHPCHRHQKACRAISSWPAAQALRPRQTDPHGAMGGRLRQEDGGQHPYAQRLAVAPCSTRLRSCRSTASSGQCVGLHSPPCHSPA